jgi:hypothetical protein
MGRNYPDFPFATDLETFRKAMRDDDYYHYVFLMVLYAEKERERCAAKEARRRERIKREKAQVTSGAGTTA